MTQHHSALVERPIACAGKGYYVALVYYGAPGGQLYHKVFIYSRRDPREKDEATVLRDITYTLPRRYRDYLIAVSVVKRCLHPKVTDVPRSSRKPYFERVFSWVIRHDSTVKQPLREAKRQHLEELLEGHRVQSILLPYTEEELRDLPIEQVITTTYWPERHASIGLRGKEQMVSLLNTQ
jgi:hypothetical protein